METVFAGIEVRCCQGLTPPQEAMDCVCVTEERVLRAYASGRRTDPMTPEQRAWCIQEADRAGEGSYVPEAMKALADQDLARTVLYAWADYCRSQGLL